MERKLLGLTIIALVSLAPKAWAGEREDNFSKPGSFFSGTDFSSRVTVSDLIAVDARVNSAAS